MAMSAAAAQTKGGPTGAGAAVRSRSPQHSRLTDASSASSQQQQQAVTSAPDGARTANSGATQPNSSEQLNTGK